MTLHTKISYIKSILRIVGYILLIAYNDTILTIAASVLVAAELLGIAEEAWPGAYEGTETDGKG
jgi:hypothetical protein